MQICPVVYQLRGIIGLQYFLPHLGEFLVHLGALFQYFGHFLLLYHGGYLLRDFNVSDYFFQILEHCLYALKWLNSTKILYMQRYHETDGPTGQHLHFQSSSGAKTENADIHMAPFAITQHLRGPNVVFCMLHFPLWRPNH